MSASSLEMLSTSDRDLFCRYGTGAKATTPFHCVPEAFDFHARTNPHLVAVEDFALKITYTDLDQQSNCVAHKLSSLGVIADSRVCLLVERSIPMVTGLLGILKAGAAYVPLDGNIVVDSTLAHIIRDSQSSVVVTTRKFQHRLAEVNIPVVALEDTICPSSERERCPKPKDVCTSAHGVYVIYTSGTTGAPKGVDVAHGNVLNLVGLAPGKLGMRPGLRVSQLMNISFDMAAWEILGSLCNGSTLCLRGKTSKEWRAVMGTVDIVVATPSMLRPHEPSAYPNIKTVAVAGEPCPKGLADAWGAQCNFYNSCGPTEITIVNTMQLHIPGKPLSIGGPTPNNTVYILDQDLVPVPIGSPGVMWAGGAGITRGYINLPKLTQDRYRRDPFANDGSVMFNTGDLGKWLPGGQLEPLGRVDNQVKVKGFRVELDGVSAAMETCPGIKAATTLLIDGELCGFAMPAIASPDDIKTAAAKVQPYYAVPSTVIVLEDLPKTANGKIDKNALKQLALADTDSTADYSRPRTPESSDSKNSSPPSTPERSEPSLSSTIALKSEQVKIKLASASSLEKEEYIWTGYQEDEMPDKTQGKYLRNLRHQIFTLYRRLFGLVFVVNMAVFIWILVTADYDAQRLGGIVVANLFSAILMRQDHVINIFFNVFCSVPTSWPLAIRRICARVYHIGGLHSGFAISGLVWLILFTAQATKELVRGGKSSAPTVAVTYVILALLVGIVAFAHPKIRAKYHDNFEMTHRFLGWSATALVWVQFMFLTIDYKTADSALGQVLVKSPPFWLLIIMTSSIILPWLKLRKVPVRSEVLSNHAVRLHFDYVTPTTGSFTRISYSPLLEWHSFATFPEPGKKGYSLVVSRAGDWTSRTIQEPPKHIWVRGVPTCGVITIVPLFRKIVLVATGSGMGPCAPAVLEQRVPMKVLWTSPDVRKTFGDKFVDAIVGASPDAVIYDTRKHGKPDMVKLTHRLVKESGAEAVIIISNQTLTRKVVYGMMSRGIPAFGAIWDS
ncbi:nonribosomal peptide synthetase 12 [Ephemerocybe angulata]|uniref:Nonribosomal peptide synthetase 12 n=1 Tax=Ephemerocybe angulata TaxID=980116 RepID=A0A8H6I123_9AGAR|nr:nonribosomal peptide synthetase 12 [Tulosesus angulatus]